MTDMRTFIIMWDMLGLECIVDADKLQGESVMSALRGEKSAQLSSMIHMLRLRARMNSQRCYEIYSVNTVPEIDENQLETLFNESPQAAAELIRKSGTKLYSDRHLSTDRVIQ